MILSLANIDKHIDKIQSRRGRLIILEGGINYEVNWETPLLPIRGRTNLDGDICILDVPDLDLGGLENQYPTQNIGILWDPKKTKTWDIGGNASHNIPSPGDKAKFILKWTKEYWISNQILLDPREELEWIKEPDSDEEY